MASPDLKYAPREIFEQILEYCVIPTFDVVIELPHSGGVVMVRRKIEPYKNTWALPGLRMFKPESIDDVLTRIAWQEVGLEIDVSAKRFLGQFVGRFRTEHERQDISTAYVVPAVGAEVTLNPEHFSGHRVVRAWCDVPRATGAMYRFYLSTYFGEHDSQNGKPPGH